MGSRAAVSNYQLRAGHPPIIRGRSNASVPLMCGMKRVQQGSAP
jgi:hypothetical protein